MSGLPDAPLTYMTKQKEIVVAIDGTGGDRGFLPVVNAVRFALALYPSLKLIIFGPSDLSSALAKAGVDAKRYEFRLASQNIPHVPYEQKNGEMYPLALSRTKLFESLFSGIVKEGLFPWAGKDLEIGEFENGMVIVNHRSTPWEIPQEELEKAADCDFQYPTDGKILIPHTAVWLQKTM